MTRIVSRRYVRHKPVNGSRTVRFRVQPSLRALVAPSLPCSAIGRTESLLIVPLSKWHLQVRETSAALWFSLVPTAACHHTQNKLGLDELPTLSFGGADGGGESGGEDGDAPAAAADKTIFKVKVTGFGDKAKIKVGVLAVPACSLPFGGKPHLL